MANMKKALSFDEISLVPRYNNIASRKDVDTSIQFGDLDLQLPIFSSNMDTITGSNMAQTMWRLGGLGFLHRFCSIEDNIFLYQEIQSLSAPITGVCVVPGDAVVSLGVNEGLDRFQALYEVGARYFCIDIAHGHSKVVGDLITKIKEFDQGVHVTAGNVCHAAGAEFLADRGADAIKVGIGPGSVCSTRVKTGFGVPQFSAIQDCRRVNCFIIADGGIRYPGDAVKAFVAGANAIMIGGMLAGTDETPGKVRQDYDKIYGPPRPIGKPYKLFRGMASKEAQDDFMGSMGEWKTAEGVQIKVPAKGPAEAVISDIMGGIHSGMTYTGANNLQQIRERTEWVEISPAGAAEGRPHGKDRLC